MTGCSHSFDKNGLHAAALGGDDEGVLWAINAGADVNALDSAGRTTIMCAVAGENWRDVDTLNDASFVTEERLNAIKRMLRHPDISLFTINAPQNSLNGVTPLGMAAWLDAPDVVKMLLEESADAVAVDGMDNHGATALMYAARDGRLEVVQILLSHGSRPDFRDCNHRTSTQYALSHPHILWLFEQVLRSHRWRECQFHDRSRLFQQSDLHLLSLLHSSITQPSPLLSRHGANTNRRLLYPHLSAPPSRVFDPVALTRATRTIISCVESEDLPFLYSILFPSPVSHDAPATRYPLSVPLLVNRPDEKTGWSPIHYCAASERPNVNVLDALYCAGADVALFTKSEEATALHILAILARLPERGTGADAEVYDLRLAELYDFTIHLISDLRAPLAARDRNDETCIHIAAERGMCIELLMILLECDTTSSVRDMRNSRGLTALDVAKPEFRVAFGQDAEKLRCASSVSTRTIRPADSFASFKNWNGDGCRYSYSSSDTVLSGSPHDPALAENAASSGEEGYAMIIAGHEPNDDGELELDALILAIMENLNNTSVCLQQSRSMKASKKRDMLHIIERTSLLSRRAISIFRSRLDDVSRVLEELKEDKVRVDDLWEIVDHLAGDKAKKLNLRRVLRRRTVIGFDVSPEQCWIFEGERERGSEDSQTTAVSHFLCPPDAICDTLPLSPNKREGKTSVLRSPSLLSLISQKLDITIPSSPASSSPLLPSTPSSQHAWHGMVGSPLGTKPDQVVGAKAGVLDTHTSIGTQTVPLDFAPGGPMIGDDTEAIRVLLNLESSNIAPAAVAAATAQVLSSWPEWLDGYFLSVDSVTYHKAHLANLMKIEQALPQKAKDGIDPKIRQMVKSKRKLLQEKIKEMETGGGNQNAHGIKESRVKAWLKKMVGTSSSGDHSHNQTHTIQGEEDTMLAGPTMHVKIVYDINQDGCNVAREVKDEEVDSGSLGTQNILVEDVDGVNDPSIEAGLRTSKVVLMAAGRGLVAVEKGLGDAEDFLSLAIQATLRAERAIDRTLKGRKMKLTEAMEFSDVDETTPETAGGFVSPLAEHGVATAIMDGGEDVRIIRRLLLRKIEGQTSDAWDELERVVGWLRIIKEVIRGVKRRAYL